MGAVCASKVGWASKERLRKPIRGRLTQPIRGRLTQNRGHTPGKNHFFSEISLENEILRKAFSKKVPFS
jgi:hypothetical protein